MSIITFFNTNSNASIRTFTSSAPEKEAVNTAIARISYEVKNLKQKLKLGLIGFSYEII